jgi:hypothetical protein
MYIVIAVIIILAILAFYFYRGEGFSYYFIPYTNKGLDFSSSKVGFYWPQVVPIGRPCDISMYNVSTPCGAFGGKYSPGGWPCGDSSLPVVIKPQQYN